MLEAMSCLLYLSEAAAGSPRWDWLASEVLPTWKRRILSLRSWHLCTMLALKTEAVMLWAEGVRNLVYPQLPSGSICSSRGPPPQAEPAGS